VTTRSMRSVIGQPLIAVDDAEQVGTVKHFVLSGRVDRIERLHVEGRGKNAQFLSWNDLRSFGDDRVMVSRSGSVSAADDTRDRDAAEGSVDVLGARILDTAGFEHGRVDDVDFDTETGDVVSVVSSGGTRFPASALRSLGSYALVVDG
jgi:uncharacterized protein YrrD